ncbi:hypothetical protein GHT06_008997 [Daphnia sinensis]|uniref:Uncharacterized protein n=1 Tax=Daphnia sinensis TaxID=1820382 RepID=A0AAD5Q387_9CRUS|nr:hypothetical protein GHT06_008997 [Daphnia sinensis]
MGWRKGRFRRDTVVKQQLQHRQATQFFQSTGRKKYLSPLSVNTPVRVRVWKKWIPGRIPSVCAEPNSYVVLTDCGRLFRRNRQAINLNKPLFREQKHVPVPPPHPVRNRSVSPRRSEAENNAPEDFMTAFHSSSNVRPPSLRSRGRPRRSNSTSRVDPHCRQAQAARSSSVGHSSVRVTRSGHSYGVLPLNVNFLICPYSLLMPLVVAHKVLL